MRVAKETIPEYESRILDQAVLDDEYMNLNRADWTERQDELPKDTVYLLSEIRALRQQIVEIQRHVQSAAVRHISQRWLVINDRGLWVPYGEDDQELRQIQEGEFVYVDLQIPSLHTPRAQAIGEVVRVRADYKPGMALEFRSISEIHSKALVQYALRRERQIARSKLFSSLKL